jgi:uncharacterized membrane protein HdeD (DUF308 family)
MLDSLLEERVIWFLFRLLRKEETMLYGLARNWWLVALRGAAGILFGILAFVWPGATLSALIMLLGAYLFIDGITTIAHSIVMRNNVQHWWLELIEGIATVLFGALTLFWPEITGLLLLSLIAIWSIITGVIEILAALRLRKVIDNEWSLIVAGGFSAADLPHGRGYLDRLYYRQLRDYFRGANADAGLPPAPL